MTKPCNACGKDRHYDARICPECKEYQTPWRNELRYWAAIAGFIAILSSGTVFVIGVLKSAWDYYCPPALLVLDYDTFGDITFVNSSNQFVFVKYLQIRAVYPGQTIPFTPRWDTNQSIEPSKSGKTSLLKLAEGRFRGLEKSIFGEVPGPYAQKLPDTEKATIFAYKRHSDYVPAFLKKDGAEYRHLVADIGQNITAFECITEISYIYLKNRSERTMKLPCIGVIKQKKP
jgi:hypothetical protein